MGFPQLWCAGATHWGGFPCGAQAPGPRAFRSRGTQAQYSPVAGSKAWAQSLWHLGLAAPRCVGPPWTGDWTRSACPHRQILIHCTTGEVQGRFVLRLEKQSIVWSWGQPTRLEGPPVRAECPSLLPCWGQALWARDLEVRPNPPVSSGRILGFLQAHHLALRSRPGPAGWVRQCFGALWWTPAVTTTLSPPPASIPFPCQLHTSITILIFFHSETLD